MTTVSERSSNLRGRTEETLEPRRDLLDHLREYARENPETTAIWCFAIGFVVGWKLKPW